jgi:pimeloyl-ACP methyl ester carboxylesterase
MSESASLLAGTEHWADKDGVKLFLWNKCAVDPARTKGAILFVHGSSMPGQPTFDFHMPGRPNSSVMEFFAGHGYDTWAVDMEGYGRSTKTRDNNAPIAYGAADCLAAATYIRRLRGTRPLMVYGISSGALRAALFAQDHPEMVSRLALDAMVWTGRDSPTLAERIKRLPEFRSRNRRPIDRAFLHSIFNRDHPGSADEKVVDAFADMVLALDDSVPTGTYVDMCANLPVVDPTRPGSQPRQSSCGGSGMALPALTTSSTSSSCCPIRTSSSQSCRASPTQASIARITSYACISCSASSRSPSRCTEGEQGGQRRRWRHRWTRPAVPIMGAHGGHGGSCSEDKPRRQGRRCQPAAAELRRAAEM